ncbi:hypothetical protein ACFQ3J_09555 [Paenibacillus provencensis]|uniref:DUF5105 domain-containing protein n=1 Tax=Paenibacillus provencensis TaxID=441151 RepID=A0ABW3PWQ3_9BACL|nr:hypothetical protein [Paenibacillus sp. MER 78]MCM3128866.1 hypothetical protein [Paenibacillus sp. MER 78]
MKFKKGIISIVAVLSFVVVSGCGQALDSTNVSNEEVSNGQSVENSSEKTNTTTDKIGSTTILYQKEFSEKDPDLSEFKEGISFDLTEHVKDFFTQDIADKLQNNMESIVEHNEDKYKENMYDDESIKFNMDWFNYKYEDGVKFEFKEVNEINYDEDAERIQLVVTFYRNNQDKEIEQGMMTYSLLKNKESGEWLIATMDGN